MLPWRVDSRPWGAADKDFSLIVKREGDGTPHFVDPNIATLKSPALRSSNNTLGQVIGYARTFAGNDSLVLTLQPEAGDYLDPGIYTFTLEGENIKVDPFRNKLTVFVDLDGRLEIVTVACNGGPITMSVPSPEPNDCYYWPDFPNERGSVVNVPDYTPGKIYWVQILRNLKIIEIPFIGDDLARKNIPFTIKSDPFSAEICKGEWMKLSVEPATITGWSYYWKDTGTSNEYRTHNPAVTTTYTLVLTNADGCKYELSKTITVADPKLELAKITPEMPTACLGGNTIIGVEFAKNPALKYTYTWYVDGAFLRTTESPEIRGDKIGSQYSVNVEAKNPTTNLVCTSKDLGPVLLSKETFESTYKKLEAMGFKPYPCRLIRTPGSRATPELRDACTGVEDFSKVREIEWDATIVDLKQRVCDDVAAANAEGFGARGYLFEDICDEGLNFQRIMRDVRTDPHNMDQVIVYLDRKNSDEDVFFQYFEEYDKFLEETVFIEEYELRGSDCKGTLRLNTSGATLNSWKSWIVQSDFVRNLHPTTGVGEFQIPKASSKSLSNAGHADLAIPWTGEIFEVKSGEISQIATTAEKKQLNNYVEKAIEYCKPTLWRAGLLPSYPYPFAFPRYLPHVDPNKVLQAWWAEAGIIKYRELARNGPQITVPLLPPPLPPVNFPEATKKRIRKHFQDTQLIQDEKEKEHVMKKFLRDNPEVFFYLLTRTVDVKAAIVAGGIAVIVVVIADDLAGIVMDDAAGIAFAMKLFQVAASL